MSKKLTVVFALLFTLAIACTAVAAPANPYTDVPAGHWAYQAVTDLHKAGIMEGHANKFMGNQTLTRYEIAAITARAMAKSDKADAATKATIDKLAAEFSDELKVLGVRVDNLEKKVGSVKLEGNVRARYIHQKQEFGNLGQGNAERSSSNPLDNTALTQDLRARIMASAQITEDWKFWARFEGTEDFMQNGNDAHVSFSGITIEGPVLGGKMTLGRFDYVPVNGLVHDDTLDGVKLSFGEKDLKANLVYARPVLPGYPVGDEKFKMGTAELRYALNKDVTLSAAYHKFDAKYAEESVKSTEVGFNYQVNPDWAVNGSYAKTSLPGEIKDWANHNDLDLDKAWAVGVNYKGADIQTPGTWGAYANYRNFQPLTTWSSTYDSANIFVFGVPYGFKGYEVGFDYAPMKNSKLKVYYIDGKSTFSELSDLKQKYFRTQLEVFF